MTGAAYDSLVHTIATTGAAGGVTQRLNKQAGELAASIDPSGAVIGVGAYDAWGSSRPNPDTTAGSGATLLAGLTGSQPFGFAGQYLDAEAGTYDMRAREYSPQQGRFQSVDPQPGNPQVPVTYNPYEYDSVGEIVIVPKFARSQWPPQRDSAHGNPANAGSKQFANRVEYAGEMPTDVTDASGMNWLRMPSLGGTIGDEIKSAIIKDFLKIDQHGFDQTAVSTASSGLTGPGYADILRLSPSTPIGSVYQGEMYTVIPDFEPLGADGNRATQSYIDADNQLSRSMLNLQVTALHFGLAWKPPIKCAGQPRFSLHYGNTYAATLGGGGTAGHTRYGEHAELLVGTTSGLYVVFGTQVRPGFIGVSQCKWVPGPAGEAGCQPPRMNRCVFANKGWCLADFFLGDSLSTVAKCEQGYACNPDQALLGLAFNLALTGVVGQAHGALTDAKNVFGPKTLADGVNSGTLASAMPDGAVLHVFDEEGPGLTPTEHDLTGSEARTFLGKILSCARSLAGQHCFPAGTLVATPGGETAIEQLHVGDHVLSEDPATGKVEAEAVQAVLVRSTSPLIALDLSDGSTLKVQPNHAFWVESDPGLAGSGWMEAGQLHAGDRLRTATGQDVYVVRVRWNVGEAVVYTLTVANDHTFFVGLPGCWCTMSIA